MSMLRHSVEKRCQGCRMHPLHCLCDHIPILKIKTKIDLIVHVKEYFLPSTTSFYTQKIIPDNCQIHIRGQRDNQLILENKIKLEGLPLVLFPTEDAHVLDENFIKNNPGPYHLIVPDGTWSQAQSVSKREPMLYPLTKIKLNTQKESKYKLRKSPHPYKLCTMESIIEALKILEHDNLNTILEMEKFFEYFVDIALKARNKK